MKRFDRAMYAFFLLALLADVARSQVISPTNRDSASELTVRRSQYAQSPLLPRRLDRSSARVMSVKGSSFTLARWARILSAQSNQSPSAILMAVISHPDACASSPLIQPRSTDPSSRTLPEHNASPAP